MENIIQKKLEKIKNICKQYTPIEYENLDRIIYEAYNMFNEYEPNVYEMGKVEGNIIKLMRKQSSKCLLSEKVHDSDNAYIRIHKREYIEKDDMDVYDIYFGCYRECGHNTAIGYITHNNGKYASFLTARI
jgi:hypothetical protein